VIAPFAEQVALLDTIPGIDRRAAEVIVAEIGPDMGQFPTAAHLASWSYGRNLWMSPWHESAAYLPP
jgi:transposase